MGSKTGAVISFALSGRFVEIRIFFNSSPVFDFMGEAFTLLKFADGVGLRTIGLKDFKSTTLVVAQYPLFANDTAKITAKNNFIKMFFTLLPSMLLVVLLNNETSLTRAMFR